MIMTLFGNWVIAGELVKMGSYWIMRGLYSNVTANLIKRRPCEFTDTWKEHHEKMVTEVGVIHLRYKGCLGLPKPGRVKEGSSSRGYGGSVALPTLRF